MRIALSFPGCHRRGGVERVVSELAHYLASRRHQVHVYANQWESDGSQPISFHRVRATRVPHFLYGLSYFYNCTRQLKRAQNQILSSHGCVCPTGGVFLAHSCHRAWLEQSKLLRKPLSGSRLLQRANPLHAVLLRLERHHFAERRYQKIVALTEEIQLEISRHYGVPREDFEIIPNGFSPYEFNPKKRLQEREQWRASLGLEPSHTTLLFVANELDRKGFNTILDAMNHLNRPQLRLLVVGKTSPQEVQRRASQRGLEGQVIHCGATPTVANYHAASDIFVLPTQYEAFCLSILEALGSGLPVVTTRVPGARNAIIPGENGFIIDDPQSGRQLAAALQPLLDEATRRDISAKAPATVEEYQWPTVLAKHEDVLREVAQG